MCFEINIDYSVEKIELSRKRMEARLKFRYVDRVPVLYCVVPRYFACISLLLAIIISGGSASGKPSSLCLAKDGATEYVIAIDAKASAPDRHAAEDLAALLKQATGAEFPICTPEEAGSRPRLAVGTGAAKATVPGLSLDGLGADGIVIKAVSPHIILTGGSGAPRGTLYAVYTFLEDYVGFRWWTRSETTIPKKSMLVVRSGLNVRYVPPLERRETSYVEARDKDWAVRMKNNAYYQLDEARGGSLNYVNAIDKYKGAGCHSFMFLVPPGTHFAEHPEWFSEIDGVRTAVSQLCLTNPELLQFVIGKVKEWLRTNPPAAYVSVSQNDRFGWCTCAKCKAVDDEEGGQSGTMIRFVNAVAEGIEKEFPNVAVDTFAYLYTQKAPKITKPRKNVVVRLCSMTCNFAKPLEDKSNQAFRKDIESWAKITDRLYVWDYVTNLRHYLQAHPNLRVLGPNIRFFVKHNVKGIFEQGNGQSPGGEFAALRNWMITKLLWNPNLDDRALLKEFLDGYYGPAAPHINRYINLIHDTVARSNFYMCTTICSTTPYLAPEILDKSVDIFEQAKAAAAGQPEFLRRVEIAEMSVLYSLLDKAYNRFLIDGKLADEKTRSRLDRFAAIAQREKITQISEGGAEGGRLASWTRCLRQMVTMEGTGQTSWTAKTARGDVAVTRLTAFWKFAPDSKDAGVAGKWFANGFDDAAWATNRNDLACGWERQGCPGYTGFGWYRQKFDLPADLKREHIYLYFGAVDEEAWIYLNGEGKTAFEHTCASTKLAPNRIWNTPFLFEATGRLHPGESNLLAVRVYSVTQMGGVWRPVYVIASDAELTLKDAQEAVGFNQR